MAKWPYSRTWIAALIGILVLTMTVRTRHQLTHWQNSVTLFDHALEVTDDNYLAHNNLGVALNSEGNYEAENPECAYPLHAAKRHNLHPIFKRIQFLVFGLGYSCQIYF